MLTSSDRSPRQSSLSALASQTGVRDGGCGQVSVTALSRQSVNVSHTGNFNFLRPHQKSKV